MEGRKIVIFGGMNCIKGMEDDSNSQKSHLRGVGGIERMICLRLFFDE